MRSKEQGARHGESVRTADKEQGAESEEQGAGSEEV